MKRRIKLVFASDSFKGSLSSRDTSRLLTRAAHEVLGDCEILCIPIADGGEGTADAVIKAVGGTREYVTVHDPLMRTVNAYYGSLGQDSVIIEMAQASGLGLISSEEQDPLSTTSFGTGELVRNALEAGYRNIYIAIGGSATNDGGIGFAKALGVYFRDAEGNELSGIGSSLEKVAHIDTSGLIPEARDASFVVMCDVTNPLCGPNGATYVYGRQKGADDNALKHLEAGMVNYRDVIRKEFSIDPDRIAGAGAVGGMGTALKVFLNAEIRSGIETVLDLTGFNSIIRDADLIVTGEGRLDGQSLNGKAVKGIGDRAKTFGIPVAALCGSLGEGYEGIYDHGIRKIWTTAKKDLDLSEAIRRAEELYLAAAKEMFLEIRDDLGIKD